VDKSSIHASEEKFGVCVYRICSIYICEQDNCGLAYTSTEHILDTYIIQKTSIIYNIYVHIPSVHLFTEHILYTYDTHIRNQRVWKRTQCINRPSTRARLLWVVTLYRTHSVYIWHTHAQIKSNATYPVNKSPIHACKTILSCHHVHCVCRGGLHAQLTAWWVMSRICHAWFMSHIFMSLVMHESCYTMHLRRGPTRTAHHLMRHVT